MYMPNRKILKAIMQSDDVAHRWTSLLRELETIVASEQLSDIDRAALVEEVEGKIDSWPAEERTAPESWMYDVSSTDVWEYGVNGVYSEERFDGFALSMHWLFPLATSVRLTDYRLNLCWEQHVLQFKHLDIWKNILHLYITGPVGEECRTFIATDPRFRHLKSIMIGSQRLIINSPYVAVIPA